MHPREEQILKELAEITAEEDEALERNEGRYTPTGAWERRRRALEDELRDVREEDENARSGRVHPFDLTLSNVPPQVIQIAGWPSAIAEAQRRARTANAHWVSIRERSTGKTRRFNKTGNGFSEA